MLFSPTQIPRLMLGAEVLTPAQISAMSIQGLQNIVASHQRRIKEIDDRVAYEATLMYPWDESTKQMWLNEKIKLLANIAAINAWLNLTPLQKSKTNGGAFIAQATQNYLQSYSNTQNYLNQEPGFFENAGEQIMDLFDTNIAGIPLLPALAIAAAGAYMIFGGKK